ncbi:MAG: adenosylmethionine--8-amino-7-oxononanoate transaminase [Balneolales bacterium]|nr:adenosylmethionine--8-amino-7-oxononanoate transaminase [Balneolales bacterium]
MNRGKPTIWRPFTIQGESMTTPLLVKSGNGLWLQLEDGRKIADMISSWWVNLFGHGNAHIACAIAEQAHRLEHVIFAGFTHEGAERLADRLLEFSGYHFQHAFFSDNGSTAVEVALKTAFQYWKNKGEHKRSRILAFNNAYHGDTLGAMSAASPSVFNEVFSEWMIDVDRVAYPSTWLGDHDFTDKEFEVLKEIELLFESTPESFAAVIIEPLIQGAGGMQMCRPAFLQQLEQLTKRYEILVIYDEVMTGFGRTGSYFAFQEAHTSPDLICLSKGITGGFLPMGMTLSTAAVFDTFYADDAMKTLWHGHSYTGNPISCAAANASLDLLLQTDDQRNAIKNTHFDLLPQLVHRTEILNKPRIQGTVAAVDIKTSEEAGYLNSVASQIKTTAPEYGLLLRPLGDVLYLMPPYCISEAELVWAYEQTEKMLNKIKKASF